MFLVHALVVIGAIKYELEKKDEAGGSRKPPENQGQWGWRKTV
jgi:hypothetical protein